jgi:hypothetical protein
MGICVKPTGLTKYKVEIPQYIVDLCQEAAFEKDVSNYAPGRLRCWFPYEAPLSPKRPWIKQDDHHAIEFWIREELSKITDWQPEVFLITNACTKKVGISWHRDAFYADYEAWGINIVGQSEFGYEDGYPEYHWSEDRLEPTKFKTILEPGDLLQFNCKNRHRANPLTEKRISIQMWRVSKRARKDWEKINAT